MNSAQIRIESPTRSAIVLRALAAAAVLTLTLAVHPAFAGGQMMSFDGASSAKDARFQKATLLVTASNCGSAANATIKGTAEGLVDGKRRSLPLKLVATGKPGQYAVFQQWPTSGSWALTFELHGLYAIVDLNRETAASTAVAAGERSSKTRPMDKKSSPFGEVLLYWDRIPASVLNEALGADVAS
ncbi:MAG: hypothetical protein ACREOU_14285 [Candidatus Eiseniibacteriota bacterium]